MTISFSRQQRVAQAIKKEISIILQREIKDPRIQIMTTVSRVEMSRDLAYAKVLVSFINNHDKELIKSYINTLQKASSFIRSLLSKSIYLRIVPELIFLYDNSLIEGIRIANIINRVIKQNNEHYID